VNRLSSNFERSRQWLSSRSVSDNVCVAVIGPGASASPQDCSAARTVGRLLAERGISVVCGGLGGVMEAVAEGASAAGGFSIGILPGSDRRVANRFLTVVIPTGLGELRNGLVIRSADAVIAIGGSWGTLSELALARQAGLPVVTLHGWQVADASGKQVASEDSESPEAAVARLVELLKEN